MAQVIFSGPTPERPSIFGALGEGLGNGFSRAIDRAMDMKMKADAELQKLTMIGKNRLDGLSAVPGNPFEAALAAEQDSQTPEFSQTPDGGKTPASEAALAADPRAAKLAMLKKLQANPAMLADDKVFAQLFPDNKKEGFTLGEGQTRFGADGKPIANVAAKALQDPEAVRLLDMADQARARGETRRADLLERKVAGDTGKSVDDIRAEARARAEGTAAGQGQARTLAPAEAAQLGFPEGAVVQRKNDGSLDVKFTPPTDAKVRTQKIANLVAQGKSQADAANIVDGNVRFEIVPQTGMGREINEVTGTVREVPLGAGRETPPAAPTGTSLFDLVQSGNVSGVMPNVEEFLGGTVGQVTGGEIGKDATFARQQIRSAQQELVRALAVNPRFPVAEMERVRKEVDIGGGVMDSTQSATTRMRSIDQSLRTRLTNAERDANDPNLPQETRSAQAANASAIRNFLVQLGVPAAGAAAPGGGTGGGASSADAALIQKYLGGK